MKVHSLHIYPVKGLAGLSVQRALLAGPGFSDDRRWMLIDERGRFVSQREYPELAQWEAALPGPDHLLLRHRQQTKECLLRGVRAEQGPPLEVEVWDDRFQARLVETATTSLQMTLKLPVRLVYLAADSRRPVDPRYAKPGEMVSFADGYPYLITTTASLAELSRRHGKALSMRRFRPNIVLATQEAFAEDEWQRISIGVGHEFRLTKPCARCRVITIDPDTAVPDPMVMASLAAFRLKDNKVLFGMNACWEGQGVGWLSVGDRVSVLAEIA
ncbi:MAG: MOSC domain-containing protein [Bacteroidetes bacterium]|nr:MAG: MOSC domain-containing protein [Bacteroidota bacterium]